MSKVDISKEELKNFLLLTGLTRKEIAEECGVHYGTVSHWLREGNTIPLYHYRHLEKFVNGTLSKKFVPAISLNAVSLEVLVSEINKRGLNVTLTTQND